MSIRNKAIASTAAFGLVASGLGLASSEGLFGCEIGIGKAIIQHDVGKIGSGCLGFMKLHNPVEAEKPSMEGFGVVSERVTGTTEFQTFGKVDVEVAGTGTFTFMDGNLTATWFGLGGPDGKLVYNEGNKNTYSAVYTPCVEIAGSYKDPKAGVSEQKPNPDGSITTSASYELVTDPTGKPQGVDVHVGAFGACDIRQTDDPNKIYDNERLWTEPHPWWRGKNFGDAENAYYRSMVTAIINATVAADTCPADMLDTTAADQAIAERVEGSMAADHPELGAMLAAMLKNNQFRVLHDDPALQGAVNKAARDSLVARFTTAKKTPKDKDGNQYDIEPPTITGFTTRTCSPTTQIAVR